jgi:hypothetical protein
MGSNPVTPTHGGTFIEMVNVPLFSLPDIDAHLRGEIPTFPDYYCGGRTLPLPEPPGPWHASHQRPVTSL